MKKYLKIIWPIFSLFVVIFLFNKAQSAQTNLIITEIGAFESNGYEWLEIYNNSEQAVNLQDWSFWENQTKHRLNLVQGSETIPAHTHALIVQDFIKFKQKYPDLDEISIFDSSWQNLNEQGEEIGLINTENNFVEKFTYLAHSQNSLERINYDLNDYTNNNWQINEHNNSLGLDNRQNNNLNPDNENNDNEKENNDLDNNDNTDNNNENDNNDDKNNDNNESNNENNNQPVIVINYPTSTWQNCTTTFSASQSYSNTDINDFLWDFGQADIINQPEIDYVFSATGTKHFILEIIDQNNQHTSSSFQIQVLPSQTCPTELKSNSSTNTNILISEFVFRPLSEQKEWIELYNFSSSTIDLNGWSIFDNKNKIKDLKQLTIPAKGFLTIELNSYKLNNDQDSIQLFYQDKLIDSVSYSIKPLNSNIVDIKKLNLGDSVAREKLDYTDQFKISFIPTPNEENIILNTDTNSSNSTHKIERQNTNQTHEEQNFINNINTQDLLINELLPNPDTNSSEWVEIYNNTNHNLNCQNCYIQDASLQKTFFSYNFPPHGYFIINNPKGKLNNTGDIISLYLADNKLIDQIAYGHINDLDKTIPINSSTKNYSLARINNTNNWLNDFKITLTPTPNNKNIINQQQTNYEQTINNKEKISKQNNNETTESQNTEEKTDSNICQYIIIDKLLPNPKGRDTEHEYIRLKNLSSKDLKLDNFSLVDNKAEQKLIDWQIKANDYLVIKAPKLKITLNNKKETIILKCLDKIIQTIQYQQAPEDIAYIYDNENKKFLWDLKTDSNKQKTNKQTEVIKKTKNDSKKSKTDKQNSDEQKTIDRNDDWFELILSEIFPNPKGKDNDEFIEIFNPTDKKINLQGLIIDDQIGGSKPYKIDNELIIKPQEYLIFKRQQTKINLNNQQDSVRLMANDKTIISQIDYYNAPESQTYSLNKDNLWQWTQEPTPNKVNIIKQTKVAGQKIKNKKTINYQSANWSNIFNFDLNDYLSITGLVVVPPKLFSNQYFYIINPQNPKQGLQIYNYKKEFPKLQIGDLIKINGQLSLSKNNWRVKTKSKQNIKIKKHIFNSPTSSLTNISDLNQNLVGGFINLKGEVTEIKNSYLYLDDGTDEIKIYFKQPLKKTKKQFKVGDILDIKGILQTNKQEEWLLIPRFKKDVIKVGSNQEQIKLSKKIKQDQQKEIAEKYLTATAGGLTSILFGLFIRDKKDWLKKIKKKKQHK